MTSSARSPRILIVTPEVTYLPDRMGNMANCLTAKAGGLADVSAALVNALFEQGADVHVALPNYRAMFQAPPGALAEERAGPTSGARCPTTASTWPKTGPFST